MHLGDALEDKRTVHAGHEAFCVVGVHWHGHPIDDSRTLLLVETQRRTFHKDDPSTAQSVLTVYDVPQLHKPRCLLRLELPEPTRGAQWHVTSDGADVFCVYTPRFVGVYIVAPAPGGGALAVDLLAELDLDAQRDSKVSAVAWSRRGGGDELLVCFAGRIAVYALSGGGFTRTRQLLFSGEALTALHPLGSGLWVGAADTPLVFRDTVNPQGPDEEDDFGDDDGGLISIGSSAAPSLLQIGGGDSVLNSLMSITQDAGSSAATRAATMLPPASARAHVSMWSFEAESIRTYPGEPCKRITSTPMSCVHPSLRLVAAAGRAHIEIFRATSTDCLQAVAEIELQRDHVVMGLTFIDMDHDGTACLVLFTGRRDTQHSGIFSGLFRDMSTTLRMYKIQVAQERPKVSAVVEPTVPSASHTELEASVSELRDHVDSRFDRLERMIDRFSASVDTRLASVEDAVRELQGKKT